MRGWLTKFWHDPVWSKVISGGIIAAIGAAGLYFEEQRGTGTPANPTAWENLTSGIAAAWAWLWAPLGVPRILVGLIFAAAVVALARLIQRRRRHAPIAAVAATKATVSVSRLGVREESPPVVGELSDAQRMLLVMLIREYPRGLDVYVAAPQLRLKYPAAEKLAEEMAALKLITLAPGGHNAPVVFLTKRGRDLCIERRIDN
jgi:hypothetical protein